MFVGQCVKDGQATIEFRYRQCLALRIIPLNIFIKVIRSLNMILLFLRPMAVAYAAMFMGAIPWEGSFRALRALY